MFRLATRLAAPIRVLLGLCLVVVAALAGCAMPLGDGEHEACELEPQTLSSEPAGLEEDVGVAQEELSSHSCKMSGATGYSSGHAFDIKVVSVDSNRVEWKTANAYLRMAQAAAKDGVQIRIVSGFRSMSEQQYLYSCYKNCSCNSCNLAATPGYSNHQSGHALDLNTSAGGVYSWLSKHGAKYGFKRTVPSEIWHWEWWGDDPGIGPCNGGTVKAKLTKRWSSAKRHRGKKANYTVCAGDRFKFSFTFKNKGTATWHDVDGRGRKVGSDVFLVTANGKTDKLTGKKRFSVKLNKNAHVHGDRKAKDCSTKDGCRRTTFIKGAIEAMAPKKPGIYRSRWRLRDYSKAWGKHSKGFGPKAQLAFQVVSCDQPKKECGCRVWCTDGKSQKLPANISSAAMCKSVAQTFCKPAGYLDHSFQACSTAGTGGGGGKGGASATDPSAPSASEDPAAGTEPSASEEPAVESPAASPADDEPAAESSAGDEGDEDDDNGLDSSDDLDDGVGTEEADDADFEDDDYPGYDETETVVGETSGCSLSGPSSGAPLSLGFLAVIGAGLSVRRRRSRDRARGAGRVALGLLALLALLSLPLSGCGADTPSPARRAQITGDSPLVQMFRDAESETRVPAEMLATMSWLQARLSMNLGAAESEAHGAPREHGLMAIGTGGLRTLDEVARAAKLDPSDVATDPRTNVRAAALWLAAEAKRQGLSPTTDREWASVLTAWGGDDVSSGVLRLLSVGWEGSDDDGHAVSVSGSEAELENARAQNGVGSVQQELGYPGGKWSPAASGNYTNASRGKSDIRYVVIHTTQGSYAGTIGWFKNPAAKVSSHYVVRSHDGAVTQMVDDRDIAWHDGCFNTNSIGIEHEGFVSAPSKWYTEDLYRSSARLTAWLCDKYGIPKDRKHILGHSETPDCSDHTDPGSGWNWSQYMKLVETGGKLETLKAKSVRKWSSARRYRGKSADYVACAGDDLKLSFTLKNVGSAVWHDIDGRGKKVGSDVFLVTTSGKQDALTGHKRFSLQNNLNQHVHGDRKAKNCSDENGCRKTTFVAGGMHAKAPNKPGVYHSRWRLRDYSKAWGKNSKGFGPKLDLSLKVVSCDQPKGKCGCHVWCSDGKDHHLAASIDSAAECKVVAESFCKPAKYLAHGFKACSTAVGGGQPGSDPADENAGGAGGAGGSSSEPSSGGASGGVAGSDTGAAGAGGDSAEGGEAEDNGYDVDDSEDDPDVLPVEDDADFSDDGFEGDDGAMPEPGSDAGGCSVAATGRAPEAPYLALGLVGLALGVSRRRCARKAGQ
ncbi:MAG: N-acetylmuramoyl-L-alanine amidase [Myxococcales bacterium]|nr:N-acetylmuramoyl-L-alanine amidase [Myxococcales bacterium]